MFSLGGLSTSPTTGSGQSLTLLPLRDSSLPLIATLLTPFVNPNATSDEPGGAHEAATAVVALSTTTSGSLGQGPFGNTVEDEDEGDAGEDRDRNPRGKLPSSTKESVQRPGGESRSDWRKRSMSFAVILKRNLSSTMFPRRTRGVGCPIPTR